MNGFDPAGAGLEVRNATGEGAGTGGDGEAVDLFAAAPFAVGDHQLGGGVESDGALGFGVLDALEVLQTMLVEHGQAPRPVLALGPSLVDEARVDDFAHRGQRRSDRRWQVAQMRVPGQCRYRFAILFDVQIGVRHGPRH